MSVTTSAFVSATIFAKRPEPKDEAEGKKGDGRDGESQTKEDR